MIEEKISSEFILSKGKSSTISVTNQNSEITKEIVSTETNLQIPADVEAAQAINGNNFESISKKNKKDEEIAMQSSEKQNVIQKSLPVLSVECKKQPRETDMDTQKSEPLSLNSNSENLLFFDTKSVTSSSDYKQIREENSNENLPKKKTDNLVVDSGTDDQMSSGTFSQDEISPRFAELPHQLNIEKKRAFSTSDAKDAKRAASSDALLQDLKRSTSVKDRTLSMETRSTSMGSDVSDQEIPPTTPRSDLTVSPSSDAQVKFMYGENVEKTTLDNIDVMAQSIYVGSDEYDSEISSESHLSTMQTTQHKISLTEDSKITTSVRKESTSVFESVVKLSDNVTENVLEETKTITKMAVEESILSQTGDMANKTDSDEKLLNSQNIDSKTELEPKTEERSECIKVVSAESSVVVTKTDTRSYSDVLKSDRPDTKQLPEVTSDIESEKEKKSSVGIEAAKELLKSDSVQQLVDSKTETENLTKKLSYSEVVKSESVEKKKEDPIADWGKPLGLPSPIRPSTPARHGHKTEEETQDTNKANIPSFHTLCIIKRIADFLMLQEHIKIQKIHSQLN